MRAGALVPINRPTAPLGVRNAVLRARARTHSVKDYPGPLSIKSVTEGVVAWKVGGRELLVDPGSFLVLNQDEPYSMEIDSRKPVATLCVFFECGFVDSVSASLASEDIEPGGGSPPLLPRLHAADASILPRMRSIAEGLEAGRLWLDEQFLALARDLALLDRGARSRLRTLPARRRATREELFRRVQRGQEFLHAHAADDLDLAGLAREACLSPYHFHRAFTGAFGETPHRYRTRLRLERARRLLEASEMSVTDICMEIGFESPASFSLLFRRRFGVAPSAVRKSRKIR